MKSVALFVLLMLTTYKNVGQIPAIQLMGEEDEIKIPFTFYYNFIIVDVMLDGLLPMRLLLDTGAENTLIFDKLYIDLIGAQYEREIRIMGSDFSTEMNALIARRIPFTFPRLGDTHTDVIVLQENLYHLEQFIGTEIHGILGANIFNGLVLSIDYQKEVIRITRPDKYKPPRASYRQPLTIHKSKPYCKAYTQCGSNPPDSLNFLLDTGAGVTTMLHNNTHPSIQVPENVISGNLGSGLGGYIKGYIGRIKEFRLGPYGFENVISSFQALDSTYLAKAEIIRHGIIGNQIMRRFDIAIDYTKQILYLTPNSNYYEEFRVDKSGIFLIASGPNLNHYYIQDVLPNSPAARAGLKAGDRILSVNGLYVGFFTMSWLARQFQKEKGKRIKLKIRRQDKKLKRVFYLDDLI
ncbi:MAG: aspartyl protease family protein [Saprospiraceae bacterium]|nr:aspartyl protease family protein [Saprospiraceae bacterium]